jgi:hypothetical protein
MPFFPGERATDEADTQGEEFANNARPALMQHLGPSAGLAPSEWFISVVSMVIEGLEEPYDYFIARPPYNRRSNERRPHPDVWWVWDADVDDTEGWVSQATFTDEGLIDYPDGHLVLREDEGDTIGAPPPRQSRLEAIAQASVDAAIAAQDPRMPRGNTSVRDTLRHRLANLNPSDATFNNNEDLSGMMMGPAGFMGRPPARRLGEGPPPPPEVEITEDGEVVEALELDEDAPTRALGLNGNLLVSSAESAPKTVWDRLRANAEDGRPPPVPKTTWERIRDQGRK